MRTINEKFKLAVAEYFDRYTVIAPAMNGGKLDYMEVKSPDEIVWTNELPYKSPKEAVFPRVEALMRFADGTITPAEAPKPILLLGAKPCDCAAMKVLDTVFTEGKVTDPFYKNRRDALTIVCRGCESEKPGCFCAERGVDMKYSPDCDYFITEDFEIVPATQSEPIPETLKISASEQEVFSTMPWEKYVEGCIGCGTCTFVCPTCHCFVLRDAENKGAVTRTRIWDSCMFPNFTLHAGGHNPRTGKSQRFRQRVLHKYLYIPENFGLTACTGCGRCIRSCPGGVNIRNTVADISERTGNKDA